MVTEQAPESAVAPALLGRWVRVTLQDIDAAPVIAKGQLLSYSDGGECVLRDEMGLIHHCWPMLRVEIDCPDCSGECEIADVPTWLRPYNCRHVTDADRRARDVAFSEADHCKAELEATTGEGSSVRPEPLAGSR